MNPTVREAANALARRSEACQGYRANVARLRETGVVPEWYAELLAMTPLCGLRLGWRPTDDPAGELLWIQIADEWELASVPGYILFGQGTADAAGDRYAFPTDGDDPLVFRFVSGAVTTGEPVAARLSDLLRWAPVLVWDEESD